VFINEEFTVVPPSCNSRSFDKLIECRIFKTICRYCVPLQNTEEDEKFTISNTQREGLILGYSLSSILARSGNLNKSLETKDIKNKGPHQQNKN
jgi:hypothetical protein